MILDTVPLHSGPSTSRRNSKRRRTKNAIVPTKALSPKPCIPSGFFWQATVKDTGSERLNWELELNEEDVIRVLPIDITSLEPFSDCWRQSWLAEDRTEGDAYAEKHIRADRDYTREFRCRLMDGTVYWLSEDVTVTRVGESMWRLRGVVLVTRPIARDISDDLLTLDFQTVQDQVSSVPDFNI